MSNKGSIAKQRPKVYEFCCFCCSNTERYQINLLPAIDGIMQSLLSRIHHSNRNFIFSLQKSCCKCPHMPLKLETSICHLPYDQTWIPEGYLQQGGDWTIRFEDILVTSGPFWESWSQIIGSTSRRIAGWTHKHHGRHLLVIHFN